MPSYTTEGHSGIVTVEEMRHYLNNMNNPSPAVSENMALVLAGTQQQLEIYLNRPVEPVQVRELVRSDGVGKIYLSVTPVHAIQSISFATGTDQPIQNPYIPPIFERTDTFRSVDYIPSLEGYTYSAGGITADYVDTPYIIDYVAGYYGYTDQAMKLAIMRVASRDIVPQHSDVVNMQTGAIGEVNRKDTRLPGWTDDELKQFRRHRRIVMRNGVNPYEIRYYNPWC
jgi:hypothetical protein